MIVARWRQALNGIIQPRLLFNGEALLRLTGAACAAQE
jgi:hypothetical protein